MLSTLCYSSTNLGLFLYYGGRHDANMDGSAARLSHAEGPRSTNMDGCTASVLVRHVAGPRFENTDGGVAHGGTDMSKRKEPM